MPYKSTARLSVPMHVCWKCENCGTINSSPAILSFGSSSYSYSRNTARTEASSQVEKDWIKRTVNLINNPRTVSDNFKPTESKCICCKQIPFWTKINRFTEMAIYGGIVGFFALLWVLFNKSNGFIRWILLALSLLAIGLDIIYRKVIIGKKSDVFFPVIFTYNDDVLSYASKEGIQVPTLETAREIIHIREKSAGFTEPSLTVDESSTDESSATSNTTPNQADFIFCRFCGSKIPSDSKFCGKCGKNLKI